VDIALSANIIDEVVYDPDQDGSDSVVVVPDGAAYLVVEHDNKEKTFERFGRTGKVPFYFFANSVGYAIGNAIKEATSIRTISEIETVATSEFRNGFREVLKDRGFSYPESD